MSYRGLKWQKFNFIIHPTEFQKIFKKVDCFIAIANKRVEEDYEITDKTSIIEQYTRYYNKIISGQPWIREIDWKLEIHTSLTIDPEIVQYEPFQIEENGLVKTFKRANQLEPLINVTNFCLTVDKKERLSVALYDSGSSNLGLQINYPKEIYDFDKKQTMKTEEFSNFKLYTNLITSIKTIGKKAKATRNGKLSKPNFWVTEKVIDDINNNYNVKEKMITFIW